MLAAGGLHSFSMTHGLLELIASNMLAWQTPLYVKKKKVKKFQRERDNENEEENGK